MSTILMLLFFSLVTVNSSFNEGCIESERQALFMFKQDLINHANRLASWTADKDCCDWVGVVCDYVTGHVLQLHLRNPLSSPEDFYASDADYDAFERSKLRGKINPSLLMLKHLNYLDLSNNAFEGIPIPKFLGSIESLRYLNLSRTGFKGLVPHQLGNLSSLQILDLHADNESYLYVANLQWLSGLSSLEHLDLSNVNLIKVSNWLKELNTLPSLQKLYLSGCLLSQVPPPTNLNLSSLAILDLSLNFLENTLIDWIFELKSLVSLDLSGNYFQGCIFDGLKNMTSLRRLDLSYNSFNSSIPDWLYNLNSLQYLSLGSTDLQGLISSAVGNMSSAISLDLSRNKEGKIPRSMGNLCNLKSIDFSGVNLSQDISEILEILSGCVSKQLDFLGLSRCQLSGQVSNRLGNFKNLKELHLNDNLISGSIPLSIGQLSSLRVLDLYRNKLTGHLPKSVGLLANLEIFYITNNLLSGVVSEIHFDNLTKLKLLYASRNPLVLNFHPDWIPPFQLVMLGLSSLSIGCQFPQWLRSQKYLRYVEISNSGISDNIPNWFWNSPFRIYYLNLSHNQIHGQIPDIPRTAFVDSVIDLSFNNFSGPLPQVSSNVSFLDLSNNFLLGSLFPLLCYNLKETMGMEILNLGENFLFGEIPDCWMNWQNLVILDLDNNNFIGRIPNSMETLHSLQSLHLNGNQLYGEIPLSLKNCTNLVLLDFDDNELYGNIPKWLGHGFPKLKVLILRSNKFSGYIPDQLCALDSLQVLDLANNDLFGSLPRCLSNFSAMVKTTETYTSFGFKIESQNFGPKIIYRTFAASIVMKGQMLEYSTILHLVRSIDFSNNNLSGEIPVEVTSLLELQSLNLSHNLLTGPIPKNIGVMGLLESVDFSFNKLSGPIPESMSTLTFLSLLNLSYNNLIGQIPSSTQLQSLDSSSYVGNELCGLPLPDKCSTNGAIHDIENGSGESDNGFEMNWFWFGMAYGFVIGFWSVFLPLVIDRSQWRSIYACITFQTNLGNR